MSHLRAVPLVYPRSPYIRTATPQSFFYTGVIFIEPAEFTDLTDPFGLFEEDIEPENFFIDFDIK